MSFSKIIGLGFKCHSEVSCSHMVCFESGSCLETMQEVRELYAYVYLLSPSGIAWIDQFLQEAG